MKRTTRNIIGEELTISIKGEGAESYATTLCNALYMAYEHYKEKGLNGTAQEIYDMWDFWYEFSDALEEKNNNK